MEAEKGKMLPFLDVLLVKKIKIIPWTTQFTENSRHHPAQINSLIKISMKRTEADEAHKIQETNNVYKAK